MKVFLGEKGGKVQGKKKTRERKKGNWGEAKWTELRPVLKRTRIGQLGVSVHLAKQNIDFHSENESVNLGKNDSLVSVLWRHIYGA